MLACTKLEVGSFIVGVDVCHPFLKNEMNTIAEYLAKIVKQIKIFFLPAARYFWEPWQWISTATLYSSLSLYSEAITFSCILMILQSQHITCQMHSSKLWSSYLLFFIELKYWKCFFFFYLLTNQQKYFR